MPNEEKPDYPDEEIAQLYQRSEDQKKEIAALKAELLSLERRALLRHRGNQYCRLCSNDAPRVGGRIDPPASVSEQTFHDANHGLGVRGEQSRGIKGVAPAATWEEVERAAAELNPRR